MEPITEAIAANTDWASIPISLAIILIVLLLKFDHFAAATHLLWKHYITSQYAKDELIMSLLRETIDSLSRELDDIHRDIRQIRELQADDYRRELIALLTEEKRAEQGDEL